MKSILNLLILMLMSSTLLSCDTKKHGKNSLTSETILYQLNETLWKYDVAASQNIALIPLHGKEDSPVFDQMKNNIIYDTFNPASPTKSHNLYFTDFPDHLSHNHLFGSSNISVGDPSFCLSANKIVAIKTEIDANNPTVVINNQLIEIDMSGTETNNFGSISIEASDLRCSDAGDQILYSNFDRNTGLSNILIYNTTAGTTDVLTNPSSDCDSQDWSPDSQLIYATCAGSLYKMRPFLDPATNYAAEITVLATAPMGAKFYGPITSPTGSKIALEQYNSNADGIYIIDINSGLKTSINIPFNAVLSDWR